MGAIHTIGNPGYYHFTDKNGNVSYGCDQKWYGSKWKRMAGCGPSVASGVLMYLHRTRGLPLPSAADTREGCVSLMDSVWNHVTPGMMGVNTTDMMCRGVAGFAAENGLRLTCADFPVQAYKACRPHFSEALQFVTACLDDDTPVAFLNLSNGDVKGLDDWHWMTLYEVAEDPQTGRPLAKVFDGPKMVTFDLRTWYETTAKGGGFVRIIYEKPV